MPSLEIFNKTIGTALGEVYVTHRSKKKHFFRKFQGYGLSLSAIEKLKEAGVKKVLLIVDDKEEYEVELEAFEAHGKDWNFMDRDKQKILPLEYFKKVKP